MWHIFASSRPSRVGRVLCDSSFPATLPPSAARSSPLLSVARMLYNSQTSVLFTAIVTTWRRLHDAADAAHATALELAQITETALNAANAAQSSLRSGEERVEAAEADSQNLRFELEAARTALEHEQRVSASLRAEQQERHTTAEVEHTMGRKVKTGRSRARASPKAGSTNGAMLNRMFVCFSSCLARW